MNRQSAIENQKSKIVLDGRYIQDHFPGIGRYTFNLIDALARVAPARPLTILHNPLLTNTRYDIEALARYNNLTLRRAYVPTFSLTEQYRLQSEISASRAALYHTPYYIKPYFLRVPSIVTLFDLIPLRFPNDVPSPRARLLYRLAVTLAINTASHLIVSSVSASDDLVSLLGVPRAKITVVPLAADARFKAQSKSEIARVREKYNLAERYILTVGINKPHKNLMTLLNAWRQIQSQTQLVVAGAWDARFAWTADRLPPTDIRFISNIADADLPALYAGATIFIMPSLYEGFGLPPLEAMACGAPVICSNTSSLPEVVGDAALQFDPHNTDMLAALMTRVLQDSALRDELADKSLARAKEFSWERTARETLNVYQSTLQEQ